jgi:flagellar biosynthesis/type III secretory pathway chaperone
MTTTSVTDSPETLQAAHAHVNVLRELLDLEFDALKAQDLDQFEILLSQKNQLLSDLTQITGVHQPEDADQLGAHWQGFRVRMLECRDLHRRNEILIMRKLDAIRGALESLNVNEATSSVEVYDRLGQIKRIRRLRGFTEV